ncbi:hypothetical protein [Nonomuraea sp. NPDC049158]|uniref:WXG100-like domain-containing protein n=1 Tax=Nonomuraea sp. NPDC049158 TaxID=3155649 RepID=UPI00341009D2
MTRNVSTPVTSPLAGQDDTIGSGGYATDITPAWGTALPAWCDALIALLSSGQMWPEASESGEAALAAAFEDWSQAALEFAAAGGPARDLITQGYFGPSAEEFKRQADQLLAEGKGIPALAALAHAYALQHDSYARETQYAKLLINAGFWITVSSIAISAFATAASAGVLTPLIGRFAGRLRTFMDKVFTWLERVAKGRYAGAAAIKQAPKLAALGGRQAGKGLLARAAASHMLREIPEEIGEGFLMDYVAQKEQLDRGTRTQWDGQKTASTILGDASGAVLASKVAGPVAGFVGRMPGIRSLNAAAGDAAGALNAVMRFPGRALQTGLTNAVISAPAGMVSNGIVYGKWDMPTAESLLGGVVAGVGRTNTISPFSVDVMSAISHPRQALDTAVTAALASDTARMAATAAAAASAPPDVPAGGGPVETRGFPVQDVASRERTDARGVPDSKAPASRTEAGTARAAQRPEQPHQQSQERANQPDRPRPAGPTETTEHAQAIDRAEAADHQEAANHQEAAGHAEATGRADVADRADVTQASHHETPHVPPDSAAVNGDPSFDKVRDNLSSTQTDTAGRAEPAAVVQPDTPGDSPRTAEDAPSRRPQGSTADPAMGGRSFFDLLAGKGDVPSERAVSREAPVDDPAEDRSDGVGSSRSPTGDRNADSEPRQFLGFWRDLMSQVRAEAHRRGTSALDELQQFALQRAIGRIFAANPDDWMLKGGQAILSRNPGGRASTDIDLVRMSGDPDPDAMADEYEAALARDHGDQLRFVRDSKTYILHGKAVRMGHTVYCGDMEIMRLSVDLAPPRTRAVWKEPEIIPFPRQILSTGHSDESPNLRVISYHDTLAHKVSGIYTHGIRTLETRCHDCVARGKGLFSCKAGDLPYRCQDLVDILMIILNSSWDGPATHAMLHAEFAWRLEQGENLKVPSAFEIPSPDWFRKFDQYARTTPGLPYAGLTEAIPVARAFLDPLLADEAPPPSRWDPDLRRWVGTDDAPAPDVSGDTVAPDGAADVRQLGVPSTAPASVVHASADMIAMWDRLSAGDLDAELSRLKQRTDLSPAEKVDFIRGRMMYDSGYVELTRVPGPDNQHFKHLRFYAHQRGELYSHAAALMADPDTTVEIAYEPDRGFKTFQWDAHQSHRAYLGAVPSGITLDEANAAAMYRMVKGRGVNGTGPAALIDDLIELHAKPLRDALTLRQRLVDDYGVEPHRVRLAFANTSQKSHYSESQWMRAQLFALRAIQADPVSARQRMVDAMLGPEEMTAARRTARAQAVVDRLSRANGQAGQYALLWVRDTRGQPVGGRHGPHLDTRPEVLRQTIEALRARHPGRRVVLLGDDVFAGRAELEEAWRQEGVLDGVDTETLVKFWTAGRNDGQALSYAEQGLFFHQLTTQHDVVQIGMESGALEIPAMLGVPTVYFEAREHDGNKGNRWQLYWQDWAYGHFEPVLDEQRNPRFDSGGRPVTRFVTARTIQAPLPAMRRLLFGPDLPDPANRRGQPVAVYYPARVAVTVDRINRLVSSGELDLWPDRLGRTATLDGDRWTYWSEQDWKRSAYYAEQLRRWTSVDARTPEEVGRKWHGIRLALLGVLEPQFTVDQEYEGGSLAHPYTVLHLDRSRLDVDAVRISRAYGLDPGERAAAVTNAIKSLLDSPGFARQALEDLRLFQLDPSEVRDLGEAVGRVTAPQVRPYADRLDVPIGDGQPTPRQVLDRFDATRAGLPEVSTREAAAYIARHAAARPWLAAAARLDPAVQRVIVTIDQGQGHHLARHGAFAADGRLHGRVARLEDPAQLDENLRARATDAFRPGDREHRCPDTATAIHDLVAFAVAFARSLEHPVMREALATPFDPDRRPGRVSLPIDDLLGPDGHLYCAGFRIVPVDGSAENAVANRSIWVGARRAGEEPGVPEPQAAPMRSFEAGTVEFFFQVNRQRDGYEISTMFVDPPPAGDG